MFAIIPRLSTIASATRMWAEISSSALVNETMRVNLDGISVDLTPMKYSPGLYLHVVMDGTLKEGCKDKEERWCL